MAAPHNIFDRVLEQFNIPDVSRTSRQGDRPKAVIDSIIRAVKAANAKASERASHG